MGESLGNPTLPPALRTNLETSYAAADERRREIEAQLHRIDHHDGRVVDLIDPTQVLARLDRLDKVLASNNPTHGNLELSLFIDRIDCDADGQVCLRMCKLGLTPDAIDLLADDSTPTEPTNSTEAPVSKSTSTPRRRSRLRVTSAECDDSDLRELADFAGDPNRFAGLPETWFWNDTFEIPVRRHWSDEYAEAVFRRKQETKCSNSELEGEFQKSIPTIRRALKNYVRQNPEAAGQIDLQRMAPRKPRIKIEAFADEAFQLWRAGASKVKLAKKYECSPPTLDKALALGAKRAGLPLTKDVDRRVERIATVRTHFERGLTLPEIADEMKLSTPTIAVYLRASFRAEGKPVPKMRRRR